MNAFDKFERFGRKTFNGQDILKNHILTQYPKVYTTNTEDYTQVMQYAKTTDYVWLIEEGIETLRSFPWWFKPSAEEKDAIHQFPYVYKASKRIKSYAKVQLVPTRFETDKIIKQKYICGSYDVYCGKDMFDIFFIGNIETGTYSDLISRFKNIKIATDYTDAQQRSTTDMFWVVPDDVIVNSIFKFNFSPDDWSLDFTHVFGNGNSDTRDGIALFPKSYTPTEKELTYRYYANKKELTVIASKPREYPIVSIKSYKDYEFAVANTTSEMFWYVPDDVEIVDDSIFKIYFDHHNQYDRNINHVFLNDKTYDGVALFSKKLLITEKEFEHRFYVNKKEHEVLASRPKKFDQFVINSYTDYELAKQNSTTEMFWGIPSDVDVNFEFDLYFDHQNQYDRNITHVFLNGKTYDGVVLFSKNISLTEKEVTHRFYAIKKEWNIVASNPKSFELFEIDSYDNYLTALENSKTDLFWASSSNINTVNTETFYISHHEIVDRRQNHSFIHRVNDKDYCNGLFLLSKHKPVTQKEIEYRFLVEHKHWDIVLSYAANYNQFSVETYNDYLNAIEQSKTEMFWATTPNVKWHLPKIHFSHDNEYDRKQNHAFIHSANGNNMYNGIFLLSKHKPVTQKEIEYRHLVERKEWDIVASKEVTYNTFYIDNYNDYLAALDNSETEMFWGISKNINVDDFDFKLYFTHDNEYDRKQNHSFIHRVKDTDYRNGVFLFSNHAVITEKEIEHRFIVNAKEWNIVASKSVQYKKFNITTYNDYLAALDNSETEMFWGIPNDVDVNFEFDMYFTHDNEYDRKTNHVFLNGKHRDGIVLFSKHAVVTQREVENRFYVNKKDWDIVASTPKPYDLFVVETYNDYLDAVENSTTDMFWATTHNIQVTDDFDFNLYFSHHNSYDRKINHTFIHRVAGEDLHNGLFLLSKHALLTQKEIEHRLIVKRKEWNIVASGPILYNRFTINTYDDYLTALETSKTEMFWMIPPEVNVEPNFKFDLYFTHNQWFERETNHVFMNGTAWDGVSLISKKTHVTEREIRMRFLTNKKQYDIVASMPMPYDIVFISKDEEHADTSYDNLLKRFARSKRVHGIEGIHAAHIEAAKLCSTDMIWIVDADAEIIDKFNFDYYVPAYDPDSRKTVHVWKSQNPINSLVYGYGAVKLLPRNLTLNMDTSKPDMTTSISPLFKSINRISNITKFNTDEFSTWRSAFRECVKLSARAIDGQLDEETEFRLGIWCTRGKDKPFGEYCIAGANAGKLYGETNRGNLEALRKINDFDWLRKQFDNLKNSL